MAMRKKMKIKIKSWIAREYVKIKIWTLQHLATAYYATAVQNNRDFARAVEC